jgi:hypothetical protein
MVLDGDIAVPDERGVTQIGVIWRPSDKEKRRTNASHRKMPQLGAVSVPRFLLQSGFNLPKLGRLNIFRFPTKNLRWRAAAVVVDGSVMP